MFVNMSIIKDILQGAEKHGADLVSMCYELGIKPSDIYHSENVATFEQAYRVWEIAVKHTNDDLLGLHIGEETNPSIMGLVGYLMQSCPNLYDAFESICSYSALTSDMFSFSLSRNGNQCELVYKPCDPWVMVSPLSARQGIELSMSGLLNVFKVLSGKKIYPQKVSFNYKKPKDISEYERIFKAPIYWNSPSNILAFSHAQLLTPVLSYDTSMMGVFCELIKKRFQKIKEETFANQIKREVMTTFMGQLPSIESLAARFNITVRTLQRKLEEEGVSYRQLTQELGKDFATSLLSNKKLKVSEVASSLGYSDARAFQRAFKSWTGQSPRAFQNASK